MMTEFNYVQLLAIQVGVTMAVYAAINLIGEMVQDFRAALRYAKRALPHKG